MGMVQIAAIAIVAVLLIAVLRQYRPEFAVSAEIAAGVILLLLALSGIKEIMDTVDRMIDAAGIDRGYFLLLIKALGVSVLTQLAADTCRDSGSSALAGKVELAGRITILLLTLPMLRAVVEFAIRLIKG